MKTINEERLGLTNLTLSEQYNINGGGLWSALAPIVTSLINNFEDVRQGFADGWGVKPPRYGND
jgi:hypothetical protein